MCVRYLTYRIRATVWEAEKVRSECSAVENKNIPSSGLWRIIWLRTGAKRDRGSFNSFLESVYLKLATLSRLDFKRLVFGGLCAFVHITNCKWVSPDSVSIQLLYTWLLVWPNVPKNTAWKISSHMHSLRKRCESGVSSICQWIIIIIIITQPFCILSLSCSGEEQIATQSSPVLLWRLWGLPLIFHWLQWHEPSGSGPKKKKRAK